MHLSQRFSVLGPVGAIVSKGFGGLHCGWCWCLFLALFAVVLRRATSWDGDHHNHSWVLVAAARRERRVRADARTCSWSFRRRSAAVDSACLKMHWHLDHRQLSHDAAWLSNHQSYQQLSIQFITADFQNVAASVIYENMHDRRHRICIQSYSRQARY